MLEEMLGQILEVAFPNFNVKQIISVGSGTAKKFAVDTHGGQHLLHGKWVSYGPDGQLIKAHDAFDTVLDAYQAGKRAEPQLKEKS